jgi:hypothetical protein
MNSSDAKKPAKQPASFGVLGNLRGWGATVCLTSQCCITVTNA